MLFAVCVDINIDASGNVHIAGKAEFPMPRKKQQYKHRNGEDCVTSIFSDASKIGTVVIPITSQPLNPVIAHARPWSASSQARKEAVIVLYQLSKEVKLSL
ncbi:hypothetical protein AVEN_202981-1 [Araneus ventricosus]|uniref:Uncharacterized protein n=1 Tax=Araneus ventricosus TaxID=182803 RepID=A0A4Y2P2X1_ARAVE|nr:hypothetical protein AVEN_202981-1 [Araneus ventricosus]